MRGAQIEACFQFASQFSFIQSSFSGRPIAYGVSSQLSLFPKIILYRLNFTEILFLICNNRGTYLTT
jgi:hypothetical protein